MYIMELTSQFSSSDWLSLLAQLLITAGAIFGGAGFWQWKQSRDQAKRDAESKESGIEKKVDTMTSKVDVMFDDMKDIKRDVILLQEANTASQKYIASRNAQDKAVMDAQNAIIESLTALLRERLLEAYTKCMEKGYYTMAERETYGKLFECYESEPFNGDGVIHDLQPLIKKLPHTAEEAAGLSPRKNQ